eukprot:3328095-Karenia_brevis.AAC.1
MLNSRIAKLERLFHNNNCDVVAVQEPRLQKSQSISGNYYEMHCVGADKSGNYGVQIWIARGLKARLIAILPIS